MTRRERAPRKPLDQRRLDDLALHYAARFSTTRVKLAQYLKRKLRESGWQGEGEPPVDAVVERFVEAGYVDDAVYARVRTSGLLRRGYGERRIASALYAAGEDKELQAELRPTDNAARKAALALAKKRRFGPFGAEQPDPAKREKQLSAMLRAGHPLASARILVNAQTIDECEEWCGQDYDE